MYTFPKLIWPKRGSVWLSTLSFLYRNLLLQLYQGKVLLSLTRSTPDCRIITGYKNLWDTIKWSKIKITNIFSTCVCTCLPLYLAIICPSIYLLSIHLFTHLFTYLLELKIRTEMGLMVLFLKVIFEMKSKVIFFFQIWSESEFEKDVTSSVIGLLDMYFP